VIKAFLSRFLDKEPAVHLALQAIYRGAIVLCEHISTVITLVLWRTLRRKVKEIIVYFETLRFFGVIAFPSRKAASITMKVPSTPASNVETYGSPIAAIA
jgi:hypothetical protein